MHRVNGELQRQPGSVLSLAGYPQQVADPVAGLGRGEAEDALGPGIPEGDDPRPVSRDDRVRAGQDRCRNQLGIRQCCPPGSSSGWGIVAVGGRRPAAPRRTGYSGLH
jgi:hypothetical protein